MRVIPQPPSSPAVSSQPDPSRPDPPSSAGLGGASAVLWRLLRWAGRCLQEVDRFVRLHFWGFTFFLTLLGLVSVDGNPSLGQMALVMGVGMLFHNFAYVLNDVVDLRIDRTQEARRLDPLVRGAVSPRTALVFALLQVPAAFGLSRWGGAPIEADVCLAVGFVLMTIYDVWGKKCVVPPLTDFAQGLAWACLVLYGALVGAGRVGLLTVVVAASATGFISLINGIHGGLRDLDNDLRQGSRTTAIFFGSRPRPEGATVSVSLKLFATAVQALLIALAAGPLVVSGAFYDDAPAVGWIVFQTMLQAVNAVFLWRVFRTGSPSWGRDFRIHIFLLLVGPVVLCGPRMQGLVAWIFPWVFVGPFLLVEVCGEIAALVRQRLQSLGDGLLGEVRLSPTETAAEDVEPIVPR